MCNGIHEEHVNFNIPKEGVAYKIFKLTPNPNSAGFDHGPMTVFGMQKYYTKPDGWVTWSKDGRMHPLDVGFCAFKFKHEAVEACKKWIWENGFSNSYVVKRIQYRGAIVSQLETKIFGRGEVYTVLLVEEFKIE